MPGTTWNWIRCSKFSSRVRSLRSRGRNRPRFFIGRVKGTCSRLRPVKESTPGYQFGHRRQTHRGRSKTRRSSKEKRSASAPHSRSLSNATSSNQFGLPSQQSTLIRVTTTKQRGAGSACDGSGGNSGLAFGSAAPASDLASQPQQFAPALYEIIRNGARKTRSKVGRHSARAAFGYPRSIAIPQNSNRHAPFCGRFSQGS